MTGNNPRLDKAISAYLLWMIEAGYAKSTWGNYERILFHFQNYIAKEDSLDIIFTHENMANFGRVCQLKEFEAPVKGLALYLYQHGQLADSLNRKQKELPVSYENYLCEYQKIRQVSEERILYCRRILLMFSRWLVKENIPLARLRVEQVDCFQNEIGDDYVSETRRRLRSVLRGFLNWLYQQNITRRNLAPFIVSPPQYAQVRPPRFLRPEEIKKLFAISPKTPYEQRSWAMLHLAYYLGLRPKEISQIVLDDILFSKQEIILPSRKSINPISVPLPETAIKAIADYIIAVRPESTKRFLFLKLKAPYNQLRSDAVSKGITAWMRKAGTPGSAYWLRHTYAQNLLESDASIFEIKEMLGHDRIQTTRCYLKIHFTMMRKVLFDETI